MKVAEPTGPFVLQVRELEQGENRLERVGNGIDLALDPSHIALTGPVLLRLVAYRAGDHIDVQGTVTAPVDLTCDRCLAPIHRILQAGVRVFAERRELRDRRPVEEVREDDLGIVYHDGRFVDLTDDVRQVLLVELPWRSVCRDDCRGLCPRCGADLNEGPCRCGERDVDSRRSLASGSDPEESPREGGPPADLR
jgi:uncharacterized protein